LWKLDEDWDDCESTASQPARSFAAGGDSSLRRHYKAHEFKGFQEFPRNLCGFSGLPCASRLPDAYTAHDCCKWNQMRVKIEKLEYWFARQQRTTGLQLECNHRLDPALDHNDIQRLSCWRHSAGSVGAQAQ
jgi:hypothetical protein